MVQLEELGIGQIIVDKSLYDKLVKARKAVSLNHMKQQTLSSGSSSRTFNVPLLIIRVITSDRSKVDIDGEVISVRRK